MKHLRLIIPVIILGLVGLFWGCGPTSETSSIPAGTGVVLSAMDVVNRVTPFPWMGDQSYAVVRREWVEVFYKEFRRDLFDRDVVRWNERFDCNHFSAYFVSLAQIRYYADNWGKNTGATTLAIGERWYVPGSRKPLVGQAPKAGHAIVVMVTENGVEHFEPQTGQFITLSKEEIDSTYLLKF